MTARTTKITDVWASTAATLPQNPVEGTTYKLPGITSAQVIAGQPYSTKIDSAKYNEILFQLTSLMQQLDINGVLPWCAAITYPLNAICRSTSGEVYISTQASNVGHDPDGNDTAWWEVLLPRGINARNPTWYEPPTEFTPTIKTSNSNQGTVTYTNQWGMYTRSLNLVYFTFDVQWSAVTGANTGNIMVPLPIAASTLFDAANLFTVEISTLTYTGEHLVGGTLLGTDMIIRQYTATTHTVSLVQTAAAGRIKASGCYTVTTW